MDSETDFDDFDFEKGEPVEAQRWDRVQFNAKRVGEYGPYSINHWAKIPSHAPAHDLKLKWGEDGRSFRVRVLMRHPAPDATDSPYLYAGD